MNKQVVNAGDVVIVGSFPKLQRVLQYDTLSEYLRRKLLVVYLRRLPYGRRWKDRPEIKHRHLFLREMRIYKHFFFNRGVLALFRNKKPALVIFSQYATPTSFMLALFCLIQKIPFVLWAERPGVTPEAELGILSSILTKMVRKCLLTPFNFGAAEIWPVGPLAEESYRNLLNRQREFCIVPLPLNLNDFTKIGIRNEVNCNNLRFVYVGELSKRKGFDLVLMAFETIAKKFNNYTLNVYGDGEARSELEALSEINPLIVYHGFKELKEIPNVYAGTDIAICPSRHDGWGNNIIEALAAGTYVISTARADSSVFSINNINGRILRSLDHNELSTLLSDILSDPDRFKSRFSREVSRRSVEELSFDNISMLMVSRINRILSEDRS